MRIRQALLTSITVAMLAVAAPTMAAVDAFLTFDGMSGPSTDPKHKGSIELSSWSFGTTNAGRVAATGAAATRQNGPGTITVTRQIDKATPLLFRAAGTGRRFQRVQLDVVKAGGGQAATTYLLTDVMITGYHTGGGGDNPTESLTLNFTKIEMRRQGGEAAGSAQAAHPASSTTSAWGH
jgi:type VI secretion system secreted protein Hcp